jgi:hypothetical protein
MGIVLVRPNVNLRKAHQSLVANRAMYKRLTSELYSLVVRCVAVIFRAAFLSAVLRLLLKQIHLILEYVKQHLRASNFADQYAIDRFHQETSISVIALCSAARQILRNHRLQRATCDGR